MNDCLHRLSDVDNRIVGNFGELLLKLIECFFQEIGFAFTRQDEIFLTSLQEDDLKNALGTLCCETSMLTSAWQGMDEAQSELEAATEAKGFFFTCKYLSSFISTQKQYQTFSSKTIPNVFTAAISFTIFLHTALPNICMYFCKVFEDIFAREQYWRFTSISQKVNGRLLAIIQLIHP